MFLQKKIMRNNPSFLPDPIPIISYNCHSRCFTVISSCIKVRAWQKAPKEVVWLPVLHFAGGLMDCFQKKNIDILHTLCALSLLSRIYVDCDCGQTNSKVEYLDENFEKFGRKLQVLKCFESTRMIKRKDKQKSLHKT